MNNIFFNDVSFEYVPETGSTNTDLLDRIKQVGLKSIIVRRALKQTKGRGTRGRSWCGGINCLTFSVAIPIGKDLQKVNGMSLVVGTKIVMTLRKMGVEAEIKWPNDILLNGRKLAGVLIEIAKAPDQTYGLVVGVGINLENPNTQTSYGHASLSEALSSSDLKDVQYLLNVFVNSVIDAVIEVYEIGLKRTQELWNTIAAYNNESVYIFEEDHPVYDGIIEGIDERGALLVRSSIGIKRLISGTISIRSKK